MKQDEPLSKKFWKMFNTNSKSQTKGSIGMRKAMLEYQNDVRQAVQRLKDEVKKAEKQGYEGFNIFHLNNLVNEIFGEEFLNGK